MRAAAAMREWSVVRVFIRVKFATVEIGTPVSERWKNTARRHTSIVFLRCIDKKFITWIVVITEVEFEEFGNV